MPIQPTTVTVPLAYALVVQASNEVLVVSPPLLPGDQVDELVLALTSNKDTAPDGQLIQVEAYAHDAQPGTGNASLVQAGVTVIPNSPIPATPHLVNSSPTAPEAVYIVNVRIPIYHVCSQRGRYLAFRIVNNNNQDYNGSMFLKLFRPPPVDR